jgi:hypothetical protein
LNPIPTLGYDSNTGEVFVVGDTGERFKIGELDPGLSEEEFREQMLEIINDPDAPWAKKLSES